MIPQKPIKPLWWLCFSLTRFNLSKRQSSYYEQFLYLPNQQDAFRNCQLQELWGICLHCAKHLPHLRQSSALVNVGIFSIIWIDLGWFIVGWGHDPVGLEGLYGSDEETELSRDVFLGFCFGFCLFFFQWELVFLSSLLLLLHEMLLSSLDKTACVFAVSVSRFNPHPIHDSHTR